MDCSRRDFLAYGVQASAGALLTPALLAQAVPARPAAPTAPARARKFELSLAAWSLHRMFFSGRLAQLDMPEFCRKELDVGGLELASSFFPTPEQAYIRELRRRAADHDVQLLLIRCDGMGDLGHADQIVRRQAVRNHRRWLDTAQALGCRALGCHMGHAPLGEADAIPRCAESFAELVEWARPAGLSVLIENHWGFAADPDVILAVLRQANDPLLGTLPNFGNFPPGVDPYEGVRKLMPHAQAVAAQCHQFNIAGNETTTDYAQMMKIVLAGGYHGFAGIEYDGAQDDEPSGVKACQRLLARFQ